jgi:SPP1 family predicted phage head-tail adaptor
MKKKLKDKKIQILEIIEIGEPGEMPKQSWEPIHEGGLWAYVRQLSAKEYYAAAAIQAGEEMLFIINWRDDIKSTTHVIKYKDQYYNIKRIDTYEGYKQDLQIYADYGTDKAPNT